MFESVMKSPIYHYFRVQKSTKLAKDFLRKHVMNFETGLDTYTSFLVPSTAFGCVSHDIINDTSTKYLLYAGNLKMYSVINDHRMFLMK